MTFQQKLDLYTNAQPFVKWVGGKRGLLSQLLPLIPNDFNNYYEPFIGGGAMFFELYSKGILQDKKVYISDINKELINTYNTIKNNPNKLIKELEIFSKNHSKEFYYEVRAWDREDSFETMDSILRATRFIYINKTCFNGLYRVNKKNQYNVPMGSYKNPNICDKDNILKSSEALSNVNITCSSFSDSLVDVSKNDFVYLDPPYYPLSETSSFTSYSSDEFLETEQKQLSNIYTTLDKRGVYLMQSNSDTTFINSIYQKYDITTIDANRFINSKASKRGKISEVLIRNYN
jgi:DNA adenine methylase